MIEPPGERRGGWWIRPASTRSFVIVMTMGSIVSALALGIGLRPLLRSARERQAAIAAAKERRAAAVDGKKSARTVGKAGSTSGAAVLVRVVTAGSDRRARTIDSEEPEAVGPGERIRVGVQAQTHAFLFGFSLDERGVMTPLFSDGGSSMAVVADGEMRMLPQSLELAGQGAERLVMLLTDAPVSEEVVRTAAAVAFEKAGEDLRRLPALAVPGMQVHRAFIKVTAHGTY